MNKNKEPKSQTQKQIETAPPKNKELQKLVQNNKHFEFLPSGKIKCILTNHEILPTLQEFQQYLNGKRYKNAQENEFDFSQFEPYIVQHKTDKNKLFCNLTRQNISKKKTVLLKHVNGKRYKHYLSKYLEEQEKLEQKQIEKENEENQDLMNELEELQNLANDDDDVEEEEIQEEPKQKQQGILKNGKKIQKKQKQQKVQEQQIEQPQQINKSKPANKKKVNKPKN